MPAQATEVKLYKSVTVSDTGGNGGRMSATEIADNVKNNLFPDLSEAARAAGVTQYRKVFWKCGDSGGTGLQEFRAYLDAPTNGGGRLTLFPGNQTNTQSGLTGSERLYGAGSLAANVAPGATELTVTVEHGADLIFRSGDLVAVADGTNLEFRRLADPGGVSWNGDQATLTLAAGEALTNGYLAATPTRVSSVVEAGAVAGSVTGWGESSAGGSYDESGHPVVVDHRGGVEESWIVTFTSATAFTCVGSVTGNVGGGNKSSNFSPNNPNFSAPYFTLASAGWGGTWQAGETVSFTTHPAAVPLWLRREVPAGTQAAPLVAPGLAWAASTTA